MRKQKSLFPTSFSIFSALLPLLLLICMVSLPLQGCSAPYSDIQTVVNKNEVSGELSESLDVPNTNNSSEVFDKDSNIATSNRKIIEKYNMRVETTDFDNFLITLKKEVSSLGGYIEQSSIDNGNFRSADFVIRIPQKSGENFTKFVDENSNTIYSETETTDITLTYVDIESRIKSYEIQKAKLEELLQNATNLSDILEIQDKLTSVIYQIESYTSQIKTYDNLIDYTTVNLNIDEVKKETPAEDISVWERISLNLQNGFENVGDFLTNSFVFFISSIPYLLLFGIPAIVLIIIITIITKKKNKKKLPPHTKK